MHPITDKLIREAVDVLFRCFLEGKHEKPKEKQIKTVGTMGIYDTNTSKPAMATLSPNVLLS